MDNCGVHAGTTESKEYAVEINDQIRKLVANAMNLMQPLQILWTLLYRHGHHSCPCKTFQAIVIRRVSLFSFSHYVKPLLSIYPRGPK